MIPYLTLCYFMWFLPAAPSGPLRQLFFVIFLYFNCLSSGWWSIFAVVIEFHLVVLQVLIQSVFELVNGLRCHYRVRQAIPEIYNSVRKTVFSQISCATVLFQFVCIIKSLFGQPKTELKN